MKYGIKQKLMTTLEWFFAVLGVVGALLHIMPTTTFLIISLAIFSKSSPRFHTILLNNTYVGDDLKRWEQSKTMPRTSKNKATAIIIILFGVSIALLHVRIGWQWMFVSIAVVLLMIIWQIEEN